jgi:uncharacterized protein
MLEPANIPDHRSLEHTTEPDWHQIIHHDRFGDLSAHSAYVMHGKDKEKFSYCEILPLYIHLSVTGRCQARCQGCINTAFTTASGESRNTAPFKDADPVRDARCIVNLISESPHEAVTICLYGGEPLLAIDKVKQLIENINGADVSNNVRYMVYTNGDLLEKSAASHPELMRNIWLYSVSIDGTKEQHERIRRGTYLSRIHAGLAAIKKLRQGHVLMWSTLREDQLLLDCFNEFIFLYEKGLVDQFFWHWVESGTPFIALSSYANQYENDLRRIMEIYVAKLKTGTLLPITHINELVLYLLSGRKRNSTACGVELARNYDIVDGKIHSCADLPPQYSIGTIADDGTPNITPQDLTWLVNYKNHLGCPKCGVHNYCGGRCPVQAVTGSMVRLRQYCQLMRLHVATVSDYIDDIAAAMNRHGITSQSIYDQSACFVQFTDGTP